jgi:hypothetical protein
MQCYEKRGDRDVVLADPGWTGVRDMSLSVKRSSLRSGRRTATLIIGRDSAMSGELTDLGRKRDCGDFTPDIDEIQMTRVKSPSQ